MVETGSKPIVTITGISGFIGSRICLDFLQSGEFHVRGTVRDKSNEAKIAPLRKAFGEHFEKLELVNADCLDAESLERAISGSTYVVHTASPFNFKDTREQLIKVAVEGTMAVMKACLLAKVKRCVVTSSCMTIYFPRAEDRPNIETEWLDENCWSNPDRPGGIPGYAESKVKAERAAWSYHASLPEDEKFELVTVLPCFVLGPSLLPGGFTSAEYIEAYFNGSKTKVGLDGRGVVDVRDVAKVHLEAVRRPGISGNRFIAYSQWTNSKDIADVLHSEFGPQGYTIPTEEVEGTREKNHRVSNKKSKDTFGIEFIPASEAIKAMAQSLIDQGVIKKIDS